MLEFTGKVIWITGLSGAGKSTLANEISLCSTSKGQPIVKLDGDELREVFGAATKNIQNHGREGRLALAMQYSKLCQLIASQGHTVVIATISMFREIYLWNYKNLPGYTEIYLNVPVEELRSRDPKGIYRAFDNGELKHVAGLDLSIDAPEMPDLVIKYKAGQSMAKIAEEIVNRFIIIEKEP